MSGNGKFVVLQVGKNSVSGKMSELILGDNDSTPLQDKLSDVADAIGKFGTIAAIAIVIVLFIKFGIAKVSSDDSDSVRWTELINYILIGVKTHTIAKLSI